MRFNTFHSLLVTISVAFIVAACTYSNNRISVATDKCTMIFAETDSVDWNILSKDEIIPFPNDIAISDTSIVILGLMGDQWLHTYDITSGQHISSAIYRGDGPEEIITGTFINQCSDSTISIYDQSTSTLLSFDKNLSVTDVTPVHKLFPVTWGAWKVDKDNAVVISPYVTDESEPNCSFSIINTNASGIKSSFHYEPGHFGNNVRAMLGLSSVSISPDGKHLASVTLRGGIMEFMEIAGDSIRMSFCDIVYPIKFETINGNQRVSSDSPFGFTAVCATDSMVFASFSGTTNDTDAKHIGMWMWNGDPIRQINTDKTVLRIAVDINNHMLYGVILDEDGNPQLANLRF